MAQVLVLDEDPQTLLGFSTTLRGAGYGVVTASSGLTGLDMLREGSIDLVLSDLRLSDIPGYALLERVKISFPGTPFVVVAVHASACEAVAAMKLGAVDFLEKPVRDDTLLQTVRSALVVPGGRGEPRQEAHSAARWARALVAVVDAQKDPRTVSCWSRLVFASPGTVRTWCRTAGVSARRSLVFARLLRAVILSRRGAHRLEDLLDVADLRTVGALLTFAGLERDSDFPRHVEEFLNRQSLVRDSDKLREVRRVLDARHPQ
jgi:CheY-like chemotaxis protein